MRVLTYNLLAGQVDDELRLREATSLLRAAHADVLVLNEAALLDRAGRLQELETALEMRGTLALARSGYHVALLVRCATFEHVDVVADPLSHVALVAAIRVGSHELHVIGAHLDPFSADKRLQEAELLLTRLDTTRTCLLLGDLNAVSPRDAAKARPDAWVERYRARHLDASSALDVRALAALERRGLVDVHAALHSETMPTRPTTRYASADRPSQRLDYIFATTDLARTAVACAPFKHASTETASDHRPLYADFAWP